MKKIRFLFLGMLIVLSVNFYSCEKDDGENNKNYSLSGTTWIYSNEESRGKNTFVFNDEQTVSLTQDWIDSGTEYTETKNGTYSYNHPSVSISVGTKEYAGTIDAETMNIGGFIYHKQ